MNIEININDKRKINVPANTTIKEIVNNNKDLLDRPIVGAKVNNEIVSANYKVNKDANITLFDNTDINGYKMYQAGLKFVLEAAIKTIYGGITEVIFDHSIGRGIHATIKNVLFEEKDLPVLKNTMQSFIDKDLEFTKINVDAKEAMTYYKKINQNEKAINIHNVSNQIVVFYKLNNFLNYYYVDMPFSTKCLDKFDILFVNNNEIVLMFPEDTKDINKQLENYMNVIESFKSRDEWLDKLNIPYISDINKVISEGNILEIVRTCETNFNNRIFEIARSVIYRGAKYLMLAGPSSSGKTTTAKKLCLTLKSMGMEPLLISTDDYFKDKKDSPKNEDGSYNFEGLDAIDIEILNKDLKSLINNEEVNVPQYNFLKGMKEFGNRKVKLGNNGIIVIEGLHSLNDELTKGIDPNLKYKVYLSPFISVNIDRHNYISSTDLRLLRRMIRDNNNRGTDPISTIESWHTVRTGEEENIFPFISQADVIINTALPYEVGVLKVYALPLLFSITTDSPYYEEARRLIDFLRTFFEIPSEYVTNESIIREFIGGSAFRERGEK